MKIIRSKRRSVSLSVGNDGEIIVRAPKTYPDEKIAKFVEEKSGWIERQRNKLSKVKAFEQQFDFENKIYILGEECSPAQFDMSMLTLNKDELKKEIEKVYEVYSNEVLPEIAKEVIDKTGLKCNSIKLTKSKRVWGSFDRQYNMKLNHKLIVLPREIVVYVVIHELCHGLQLNHSPKFWANVKSFCPNYKKLRNALKMYAFLL